MCVITKAVTIFNNGRYEIYFVDENNKRASENKKIDGSMCIFQIYSEAKRVEQKLFKQKVTPKELF